MTRDRWHLVWRAADSLGWLMLGFGASGPVWPWFAASGAFVLANIAERLADEGG